MARGKCYKLPSKRSTKFKSESSMAKSNGFNLKKFDLGFRISLTKIKALCWNFSEVWNWRLGTCFCYVMWI